MDTCARKPRLIYGLPQKNTSGAPRAPLKNREEFGQLRRFNAMRNTRILRHVFLNMRTCSKIHLP